LLGIKGKGLFVIGGFDQVASMLCHANLNLAYLVDINATAVEYARLRLALADLSYTREEYLSRLVSRKLEKGSDCIVDLLENLIKQYDKERSIRIKNLMRKRCSSLSDLYVTTEEMQKYIEDYGFNENLANETAQLLESNYGIVRDILEKTILNKWFISDLLKDDEKNKDYDSFSYVGVAGRRMLNFMKFNKDNWLATEESYQKVSGMYKEGKIKLVCVDLMDDNLDLSDLGEFSLVYTSNIHECVYNGLNNFVDLCESLQGRINISEDTMWIITTTEDEGRGHIKQGKKR